MNSRKKGASGERELARILRDYGYDARRGQQYSGANGDADVAGLPGVHIECKRVERLNLSEAMNQNIRDARPGEIPAVFHRKNCEPWKVTMILNDWLKLYGNQREKWILCSERLPEEPEENPEFEGKPVELYLVCAEGEKYPFRAFWNGRTFADGFGILEHILAWMPLLTTPEGYHD